MVLQSGVVTPNHIVRWATDGVIQDGGTQSPSVLAALRGANFNSTSDQPIAIPATIVAFQLTGIIITNASISLSTAVGGFYPAALKGGTPIVAASQTYSALTGSNSLMTATLAAFGTNTRFSSANLGQILGLSNIWFSLTVPQGVSAVGDIFLVGVDLS
jgi:hypothetical protein